jgi:hypothetical protein
LRLPTLCQNLEYVESGREVAARSPGRTRTSGWFLDRRQSGERKPRAQEKPATRGGGRSWLELSIGGAPRSCPTSLVLLGPEPCNPVYYWMACSALSERWVEAHRIAVPCRLPHVILSNHPKSLFLHYCRISVHFLSTNTCAIPVGLDLDQALFEVLLVYPPYLPSGSHVSPRGGTAAAETTPVLVGWDPTRRRAVAGCEESPVFSTQCAVAWHRAKQAKCSVSCVF